MDPSDEYELIVKARNDPDAFGKLYERYVERIYRFAYLRTHDEALAKDITSTTFEKALRHIQHYQWRGLSFGAWLYRIARNEIAQHQRRFFLPLPNRVPGDFDIERIAQAHQQHEALFAALIRLSHADRELITLRYLDDLSSAEVAEILGCSVNNVYRRLYRALGRLRQKLELLESSEVIYVQEEC